MVNKTVRRKSSKKNKSSNKHKKRSNKHRKGKGLRKHKRMSVHKRTNRRRVYRGGNSAFAGKVWNAKDGGNYYAINKTGGLDTPMNSRFYNMAGKGNLNDLAKSQNIQMGGGKYTRKQRRNRRTKQNGGNPFKNLYRNVVYKGEQFVHGLQGKPQPVNPSVSVQPIDSGLSKTPKIGNLPPNVSNVVKQADAQVAGFN